MNGWILVIVGLILTIFIRYLFLLFLDVREARLVIYNLEDDDDIAIIVSKLKKRQLFYCAKESITYLGKGWEYRDFSLALLERIASEFSEICFFSEKEKPKELRTLLSEYKSKNFVRLKDSIRLMRVDNQYCLGKTEKIFLKLSAALVEEVEHAEYKPSAIEMA